MNKHETALEQCWEISTDNSITEDNKIKMIRDLSRATLDGEPTTADEYNDEEDVQLGYSIVKSNDEIEGVFIQEGKIVDIDYFDDHEKTTVDSYNEDCPICGNFTNNEIKATPKSKKSKSMITSIGYRGEE